VGWLDGGQSQASGANVQIHFGHHSNPFAPSGGDITPSKAVKSVYQTDALALGGLSTQL
jgi:hypothetical protein